MKLIFTMLGLLVFLAAQSQKVEKTFGQLSHDEIKMSSSVIDPEAKAVVLFDKGKSLFFETDNGFNIQFTKHKRIKIFDKSATEYAEISIPYYKDGYNKTEVVESIEATTYNFLNGKLIRKKLEPSSIYEEQVSERWFNKKFIFPDVQDGSILEYRYVLESPFHFNLPDWTFQSKIPTIYSEYEVRMIPFYEYVYLVQGISKFDLQESVADNNKKIFSRIEYQDYIHRYALKNIPSFKDESYITSINDYITKIDFQLSKINYPSGGSSDIISSWPELNKALLKHEKFGKYLKNCTGRAKKILEELDLTNLSKEEQGKKIIEYIKNHFEWNGYYGKYTSQSAKDFITNKKGNVADINLFLISMLNAAGIEATPLILSTRDHGKIHVKYPFDKFTNYVVVLVETGTPYLADATENQLSYNRLPVRCFNDQGLIVDKEDQSRWVQLNNNTPSFEKSLITMRIDSLTFDANVNVSIQSTGYESYQQRKKFNDDTLKIKDFYKDKIGNIEKVKTIGYEQISRPYAISVAGKYETEKLENNIILKPLLNLPYSKNHLTQKSRSYPVDFVNPKSYMFECILDISNGFSIADLPDPFNMDNELAEIHIEYLRIENILKINGLYKFKKAVYVANEYARIKYYLDQIVKRFNEPIVLEKTN